MESSTTTPSWRQVSSRPRNCGGSPKVRPVIITINRTHTRLCVCTYHIMAVCTLFLSPLFLTHRHTRWNVAMSKLLTEGCQTCTAFALSFPGHFTFFCCCDSPLSFYLSFKTASMRQTQVYLYVYTLHSISSWSLREREGRGGICLFAS